MSEPTSVYTYFDALGHILYVGVTGRGVKRGQEHARTKEWWPLVTTSTVVHFDTRERALAEESYLIRYHRPPYNTAGKPSGPPRWQSHTHAISTDAKRAIFGNLSRPRTLSEVRVDSIAPADCSASPCIRALYDSACAKRQTVAQFRDELRQVLIVEREMAAA